MKDKHIALRLGMAFAVLIAVLVGIGQLGLRRMHEINDTLSDITGRRSDKLRLAQEALRFSNRNSRITMEIFLVQDRALTGMLLAERSENTKNISGLVAKIASRCESEEEKQRLSAVEGTRKPYIDSYLRALHLLVDEGEHHAAVAVMVNETLPALLKYHTAWDEFVEFQKIQLDVAAKQAGVDYAKARHLAFLLIVLAVAVALGIGVLTTRQAHESLQNSENKYRVLFEDSADANWLMDEKGFLDCNSAALQMFGYSAKDEFIHPADISPPNQPDGTLSRVAADQHIASAFLKGEERFEWLHQRKNGSLFPAEVCLTALTLSGQPKLLATVRNITERRRAEEALMQEQNLLRTLIDNLPDFIYAKDTNNRFLLANEALARRMGAASSNELLGKSDSDFYPPDIAAKYAREEQQIMQSGQPVIDREEATVDATTGQVLWHTTTEIPLRGQDGSVKGLLGIGHIITERKRWEESLRDSESTNRATFEHAALGIAHVAPDGRFLRVNDKLCAIVGYTREELINATFQDITHPDDLGADLDQVRQVLVGKIKTYSLEKRYLRKDRSIVWVNLSVSLVRADSGSPRHFISIVEDITERKRTEERVQFLAYYDALTELPNRALFKDRMLTAVAGARRRKEKLALLFMDIDRFKTINDSLGHAVGDLLLRSVAERIKGWARAQDTVARWGGDEFLILLTGLRDETDAAVAAERLMDAMHGEFTVQSHSLNVTCSLGISVFPDHGLGVDTLVKNADAAMYCAKEYSRNNFQFFTEKMNSEAKKRLTLEHGLRKVLERDELFLAYQPQMDVATGRIIGLEALLRWQHPKLGVVPPDEFIRIAENSGLILPIGEWVLRTACTQLRKWHEEGLLAVPVAVNVSAVQFRHENFRELVRKVLRETALSPEYLELELTESVLLSSVDVTLPVLQDLKAMGVRLAIDDFGTGYSSLSYLRQFPVSKLKIDRSFVQDVALNPDDAAITAAIISMAKSLNLRVIAEGVEDEAQMAFLREHRCDEIQGYYFSKPLTVDEAAEKLRRSVQALAAHHGTKL